jgi:hypothetical protein
MYRHLFRSQLNFIRFYLKNTKLQCCLMWRFAIFKLKSAETYWFTQNYVNENTRFSCRFKCLTQMTHLKTKKTIILLKVSKFCHNGSNTARLNLKIDRFQVNNEYSRIGMRTEQIHIEINFSRFYLKNTKLQCCLMWRFAIFKLKSAETYWFTQPI